MVPVEIQDALLDELKQLTPKNGNRLLEIARAMHEYRSAASLEEVLDGLPVWDEERANEMERIIEEGCEQIDVSKW
ncbi:MAG TPA: hypothetical protein VGM92_09550 [Candidatus Kapabacteria bacterium]|jgi:hypothetical protein